MLLVKEGSYYAWRKRGMSRRSRENVALREHLLKIVQNTNHTYGSRRATKFLRSAGIFVNRKRVAKIMREGNLNPRMKRKTPAIYPSTNLATDNVLNRRFRVPEPNRYWASDITYIPTRQGWLYLAVTMDLFSRRIIGWSMDRNRTAKLVLDALRAAIRLRRPSHAFIHHTDRGTQYTSDECIALVARTGGISSLSRKGNCWDNAVVESFFATLKRELVADETFTTRDEARLAIFEFIEGWYNPKRMHSTLGYVSPMEFEAANGLHQ